MGIDRCIPVKLMNLVVASGTLLPLIVVYGATRQLVARSMEQARQGAPGVDLPTLGIALRKHFHVVIFSML